MSKLSEVRAAFADRRWTPLPDARSAPGSASEAPPGGSGADPRNPPRPPKARACAMLCSSAFSPAPKVDSAV
eukprot:9485867-Pyramimonas_sp.AAC.1